ncbi:MAG: MmcQ/YjbR family DNA-binding protein [Pseudonocardiaceae bacterium]
MADAEDVRRVALALPHVAEIDSEGFDFRVGGKGFAWSYPERLPGKPRVIRTDIAVLYVGDEAEKQALLLGEPDVFFTAPGYDGWPLVMLRLAEVDVARLTELVTDAWRMRAPHELVSGIDGGLVAAHHRRTRTTGSGVRVPTKNGTHYLASTARRALSTPARSLLISPTIDPIGSVLWVTKWRPPVTARSLVSTRRRTSAILIR